MAGGIGQMLSRQPQQQGAGTTTGQAGFNPSPFYFGPNYQNPSGQPGQSLGQYATPEQDQMARLQGFMQKLQDPNTRGMLASHLGQTAPAPTDQQLAQFQQMFTQANPTAAAGPEAAPAPTQPSAPEPGRPQRWRGPFDYDF